VSGDPRRQHINVMALSGHSHHWRLTFQPDAENVASCIGVAIVRRTAVRTDPQSYTECAHTFGAAGGDSSAARAHLGSESFVGFDVPRSCLLALVREHGSETGPAGVGNGFGHPRPHELGRVHIANDDVSVLPHKLSRLLVQEILSSVRDLGVDRASAALVTRSLRYSQGRFVLSEVLWVLDLSSVAQCSEMLQAKVNADGVTATGACLLDHALEGNVPAPTSVLNEVSGTIDASDFTGLPKPVSALQINYGISFYLGGALDDRHPAKGALRPKAGAETRGLPILVAGDRELTANLSNRVGMQPDLGCNACCQLDEIKGARPLALSPALPAPHSFALNLAAVIPNEVTGPGLALQVPLRAGVLNSKFEADEHARIL
jgi:hypothetical protein